MDDALVNGFQTDDVTDDVTLITSGNFLGA